MLLLLLLLLFLLNLLSLLLLLLLPLLYLLQNVYRYLFHVPRYTDVMKCIVRRYITSEQKKTEEFAITEDDVNEIRQDINKFRYIIMP